LENIALWHERDISHSSAERVIFPDSNILLDFMLHRLIRLLKNLQVYPENMAANLALSRGLVFSQGLLLALVRKGLSRDAAYRLVQRPAMQVWEEGGNFAQRVKADPDIGQHLSEEELEELFDLSRHLRYRDTLLARVFGAKPGKA
jgi:adenylosuccinate lyase